MEHTSVFTKLCLILSVIGALNWGLVGFFDWNLVNAIFGGPTSVNGSWVSRIVYSLVGLAGLGLAALTPRLREAHRDKSALRRRAEARI